MAWPLAVPGHRHAQWRVKSYPCMFKLLLSTFFVIALNPDDVINVDWRDVRKSRDTSSINWKWFIGVVDVMCFVMVRYWIIMTQIFHALIMVCYLVGHSYEVGIAYICYWQTISCWMVIFGLRIIDSSLGVIWDACLIWIRSVHKFTNAYSNTWNEIRFAWYGYWFNMPCKLELISVPIHW